MSWAAGTHPANTSLRSTLAGTLSAAGLVQVTANYVASANFTLDVWKSPAASNSANQDWYLLLAELTSAPSRQLFISVAEGWDDATKLAAKYVPIANNIIPAGDFSVGAGTIAPTQANIYYQSGGSFTDANGAPYRITATPDRVITEINNGTCVYAGLADRIHDVTQDPVAPLIMVALDGNTSYSPGNAVRGGSTREPGQVTANAANFRCFMGNLTADNLYNYTVDNLTARIILSPIVLKTSRTGYGRAVLKDVRGSAATSSNGISDTAAETLSDGVTVVTYWNIQAITTQPPRYVPQI